MDITIQDRRVINHISKRMGWKEVRYRPLDTLIGYTVKGGYKKLYTVEDILDRERGAWLRLRAIRAIIGDWKLSDYIKMTPRQVLNLLFDKMEKS